MLASALAGLIDAVHATAMIVWVVGLPLLFWHGKPRWSRIYVWYALAFVVVTRVSHELLGECVLTRMARDVRILGGADVHGQTSFMVRVVNGIAGLRFTEQSAVLVWEWSVFLCSAGVLFYLYRHRAREPHDAHKA